MIDKGVTKQTKKETKQTQAQRNAAIFAPKNETQSQRIFNSQTRSGAQGTAKSAYTSLPDFTDAKIAAVQGINSAAMTADQRYKEVNAAKQNVQSVFTGGAGIYERLMNVQELAKTDKSTGTKAMLQTLQRNYDNYTKSVELAAQAARDAEQNYADAYKKYQTARDGYDAVLKVEEAGMETWRKSIRQNYDQISLEIINQQQAVKDAQKAKQKADSALAEISARRSSMLDGAMVFPGEEEAAKKTAQDANNALQEAQKKLGLLQEERAYSRYFAYDKKQGLPDFAEKSQYKTTATGTKKFNALAGVYTDSGFGDILYDYINGNEEARTRQDTNSIANNTALMGFDKSFLREMTQDEVSTYNYVYATEGKDAAERYIGFLTTERNLIREGVKRMKGEDNGGLTQRQTEKLAEKINNFAMEHPKLATAAAIAESPLKGLSYLGQTADYLGRGKIDQYAGYNKFARVHNDLVSGAAQRIAENLEANHIDSKGTVWAYQLAVSMAEFLLNSFLSGAGVAGKIGDELAMKAAEAISLTIMGTGAAADSVIEAKERGLDDNQAYAIGTIAGTAEALTELVSIEALFGQAWDESLGKFLVKNIAAEGSEEIASDAINLTADILIAKDKSEWAALVDKYTKETGDPNKAFGKAVGDTVLNMMLSGLGGAISGGVMAGFTGLQGKMMQELYESIEKKNIQRQADAIADMAENMPTIQQEAVQNAQEAVQSAQETNQQEVVKPKQQESVAEETTKPQETVADTREEGVLYGSEERLAELAGEPVGEQLSGNSEQVQQSGNSEQLHQQEAKQTQQETQTEAKQTAQQTQKATETIKSDNAQEIAKQAQREALSLEDSASKYNVDAKMVEAAKRFQTQTGRAISYFRAKPGKSGTVDGFYDRNTNTIFINASSNMQQAVVFGHELTHSIEKSNIYKAFSDLVFKRMGEMGQDVEALRQDIRDLYAANGVSYANEEDLIDKEIVAKFVQDNLLTNEEEIRALVRENRKTAQRVKDWIDRMMAKLGNKDAKERAFLTKAREMYAQALEETKPKENEQEISEEADKAFSEATEDEKKRKVNDLIEQQLSQMSVSPAEARTRREEAVTTGIANVEESEDVQFGISALARAAGFEAHQEEDGTVYLTKGNKRINEVTVEDIDNSAIGALINFSYARRFISEESMKAQKQLFADLLTMAARCNDFTMSMQFAGSTIFTAIKSNADSQYKTTYDFVSICTKTQAVIDAMSSAMVEKKGGLTEKEIKDIYNRVVTDGNPVPCPECYVFSRWVGIGGLLDNIWKYQNEYGKMTPEEVRQAYDEMAEMVEAKKAEMDRTKKSDDKKITKGQAKGKVAKEVTKAYEDLKEKIEKADKQGEYVKPSERERLAELEKQMITVKAMTWIDTVYFSDEAHTKVNDRSKWFVPKEILFDLNQGEAFAEKYKDVWAFRTTQGAGYGKAITPYAEAVLGEGIMGTNSITNLQNSKKAGTLKNAFLDNRGKLTKAAREKLATAIKNQNNQAFLGGQRFQSTSDARNENAFDYLIACLEVQAMNGMVQAYTKVAGAVPMFNAWGFSGNMSLMPKNGGLENGKPVDTNVGGMDPEVAKKNREDFEHQGTITIGVNDNHIRAMLEQDFRDFIIPYHASGGKGDLVATFRSMQEKGQIKPVKSTDYTKTQSDKIMSDELLRRIGKSEDEIRLINARRQARIDIFAMNRKNAKQPDMEIVRGSRYLSELYDRLKTGEWAGVTQAKATIEHQIFPNEFWDTSVTYKDSGKITRDYLAYCEELGFLHRFSGQIIQGTKDGPVLKTLNGYDENGERVKLTDLAYNEDGSVNDYFWKLLTDRRMYDNQGNYMPQQRVSLGMTQKSDVRDFATTKFHGEKAGKQYDGTISARTAENVRKAVADGTLGTQFSISQEEYAPTFYSQMERTISEIKQPKLGAANVVRYLRGRGVKAEEIKWSGIEAWLEGKKSVTREELAEFAAGSRLQIEEEKFGRGKQKSDVFSEFFRDIGKIVPDDSDFDFYEVFDDDGNLLETEFAEGVNKIFEAGEISEEDKKKLEKLANEYGGKRTAALSGRPKWNNYATPRGSRYREIIFKMPGENYENPAMITHWGRSGILAHARIQDMKTDSGTMLFVDEIQSDWHNEGSKRGYGKKDKVFTRENTKIKKEYDRWKLLDEDGHEVWFIAGTRKSEEEAYKMLLEGANKYGNTMLTPEAPFKDTYQDFVMKRLIREAAENGYDSVGWTTAEMQSRRFSAEFAEGYRIEYDQQIPSFLKKYGKKWGGKVTQTTIPSGDTVWQFRIPEEMKKSVLHEGQPQFSISDSEYTELAKDPEKNEAQLQKAVDEAARAAGYDTSTPLYHGTGAFGFKAFDLKRMDDKISIFTTSAMDLARSYANGGDVRKIGGIEDRIKKAAEIAETFREEIKTMNDQELIRTAYKRGFYAHGFSTSLAKINNAYRTNWRARAGAITDDLKSGIEVGMYMAAERGIESIDREQNAAEAIDALEEMRKATTIAEVEKAAEHFRLIADENKYIYEYLNSVYSTAGIGEIAIERLENFLKKIIKSEYDGCFVTETIGYAGSWDDILVETREELEDRLTDTLFYYNARISVNDGIYKMYGKRGNNAVIDNHGRQWSEIDGEMIGQPGKTVTTRAVAKWAKGKGYDSVTIKGVIDSGARGNAGARRPQEVTIFFNPKDLKSADPVTYDDEGRVIPPSERFSRDTDDLRYAISEDEKMQQDWDKAVRDRREIAVMTGELAQAQEDLANDMAEAFQKQTDRTIGETMERTGNFPQKPAPKRTQKEEARSFIARKFIDSGDAVSKMGKKAGDKTLYNYYSQARRSSAAAYSMINKAQTNIRGERVGDSLQAIFDGIKEQWGEEYYKQLELLLLHRHNINRMSREKPMELKAAREEFRAFTEVNYELAAYAEYEIERMAREPDSYYHHEAQEYMELRDNMRKLENTRNKAVFNWDVTAQISNMVCQTLEERLRQVNERFEDDAQKIYKYIDNLMQYRIDSGLMTEQDYEELKKIYPNYVPVYRMVNQSEQDTRERRKIQIGKTVGRAVGGEESIMSLGKALEKQTFSVVREGSKNRWGTMLLDRRYARSEEILGVESQKREFHEDTFDELEDPTPKRNNTFTVRNSGEVVDITVSKELFEAVNALAPERVEENALTKVLRASNDLFKKLCTGWNPAFMVKNIVRDTQDALLYSKHPIEWMKNLGLAYGQILKDGKYWQQYQALGGAYSGLVEFQNPLDRKAPNALQKIGNKIEAFSQATEQASRLAEFMAVCKSYKSERLTMDQLMEAIEASAEVTVNFGRSGTWGKVLNSFVVPFWNPGIQGLDKAWRTFSPLEKRTQNEWMQLAVKCAILGILPGVINAALWGDDDEYEDIKERDKDTNYLFRIRDGMWLKLPRGRVISLMQSGTRRAINMAMGKEKPWEDFWKTGVEQVAPANPLEQNLFAAWIEADLFDRESPGKTWYGGNIESQRLQGYAPGERYDASTDAISKAIGKVTGLSPKKINYILDQYTGVAGDILLPMLSQKGARGFFEKSFIVDTATQNRLANDFYKKADELKYAKNSGKATELDEILNKFWSKQSSQISDINKAIRKIEEDPTTSKSDKEALSRIEMQARNAAEKTALETLDEYRKAAEKYLKQSKLTKPEDRIEEAYREANREVMGADYAIRTYNKQVYDKACDIRDRTGITMDQFYDFYFPFKAIEGKGYEKSNAERDLIASLNLSEKQKIALYQEYVSQSRDDDIQAFADAGMKFKTFVAAQNAYSEINANGGTAGQKRTEFARWAYGQKLTDEQRDVVMDSFTFYSNIPADTGKYEDFRGAGMDDKTSYAISKALTDLKPIDGKKQVSEVQKMEAITQQKISTEDQIKAISVVASESTVRKIKVASEHYVEPKMYADVWKRLPEFDADGNGSYKNDEIKAAIDAMGDYWKGTGTMDNAQKAVMWQLLTGNKSAKNNPYSRAIGQEVLDAINALKTAAAEEEE